MCILGKSHTRLARGESETLNLPRTKVSEQHSDSNHQQEGKLQATDKLLGDCMSNDVYGAGLLQLNGSKYHLVADATLPPSSISHSLSKEPHSHTISFLVSTPECLTTISHLCSKGSSWYLSRKEFRTCNLKACYFDILITDYFELKSFEKQHMKEETFSEFSLSIWRQILQKELMVML